MVINENEKKDLNCRSDSTGRGDQVEILLQRPVNQNQDKMYLSFLLLLTKLE